MGKRTGWTRMGLNRQERQENERMEDKKELATKRHKGTDGKNKPQINADGRRGEPEGRDILPLRASIQGNALGDRTHPQNQPLRGVT